MNTNEWRAPSSIQLVNYDSEDNRLGKKDLPFIKGKSNVLFEKKKFP